MVYVNRLCSYQMKPILTALACLICVLPALRAAEADEIAAAPARGAAAAPGTAYAGDFLAHPREQRARPPVSASWKWSLAPLVASQALDAGSSYGMRELNPMLAGPDGRFGAKAATMKLSVTAALMAVEYLIVRAHPGAARVFTKINWSGAVVTTGFAAHNFTIR
jgi:hypothetical protein